MTDYSSQPTLPGEVTEETAVWSGGLPLRYHLTPHDESSTQSTFWNAPELAIDVWLSAQADSIRRHKASGK